MVIFSFPIKYASETLELNTWTEQDFGLRSLLNNRDRRYVGDTHKSGEGMAQLARLPCSNLPQFPRYIFISL